MGQIKFLISD